MVTTCCTYREPQAPNRTAAFETSAFLSRSLCVNTCGVPRDVPRTYKDLRRTDPWSTITEPLFPQAGKNDNLVSSTRIKKKRLNINYKILAKDKKENILWFALETKRNFCLWTGYFIKCNSSWSYFSFLNWRLVDYVSAYYCHQLLRSVGSKNSFIIIFKKAFIRPDISSDCLVSSLKRLSETLKK